MPTVSPWVTFEGKLATDEGTNVGSVGSTDLMLPVTLPMFPLWSVTVSTTS